MKHYNKLLSEKEELVSSESQTSLASISDTLINTTPGGGGHDRDGGVGSDEYTTGLSNSSGGGESGTKSFTIGEGCVIGMHILLGKIGSARGWVWIDAKVSEGASERVSECFMTYKYHLIAPY